MSNRTQKISDEQIIKILQELFAFLSGYSIETTKDSLLIKADKDDFIKKILAHTHLHELGFEHIVDNKYVIFKIPIQQIGREALEKLGIPT